MDLYKREHKRLDTENEKDKKPEESTKKAEEPKKAEEKKEVEAKEKEKRQKRWNLLLLLMQKINKLYYIVY